MRQSFFSCLEKSINHYQGVRCLSDFVANEEIEEGTDNRFAAISLAILEQILSPKLNLSNQERTETNDLLFKSKWAWGFSTHQSGKKDLAHDDFDEKNNFIIHQKAYSDFLNSIMTRAGDTSNVAHWCAHTGWFDN